MEAHDWLALVIVFVLLLLSAFFAGSETALTASSRASMARLEKQGNKRAAIVNRLLEQRERLLGALLFGNNAVNIAASALATGVLLTWFGHAGVAYATVIMTIVVVVFLRDPAENRGVQRARPHRAWRCAADVLVREIIRAGADGDRGAGALAAQANRHDGRRGSGSAVGARGIARRGRPAAQRRRRGDARPRHVRRRARSARAGGVRRDDPPHQHDHAQRRR